MVRAIDAQQVILQVECGGANSAYPATESGYATEVFRAPVVGAG